eukprot:TRINITY_DN23223_c0_g1_i1.p1 TRINITY_DN23223_c0_g1~~TRINITY_DN23223_c0_g1_i1.p1  ORF type:complete len:291 (+),score=73.21 TRINITY_DN23223_c0_g1_i1:59-874(+)
MSVPSRGSVPAYSLAALMQQMSGDQQAQFFPGRGAGGGVEGAAGAGVLQGTSEQPLVGLPTKPQRVPSTQPAARPTGGELQTAPKSLYSPRVAHAAPAERDAKLDMWVTTFGVDWDGMSAVRFELETRFGAIVDCKVPRMHGNAAHYKFQHLDSAAMAVQEEYVLVGTRRIHTTQCVDDNVLVDNAPMFLRLDAVRSPPPLPPHCRQHTRTPRVLYKPGVAAAFREALPLYRRVAADYWPHVVALLFLWYLLSSARASGADAILMNASAEL